MASQRTRILNQADTCVKCGLCLPHCPTYRKTADEAESPRGRIALIQGWLGESLPGSQRLHQHLERCLECGACEQACPSLVPVIEIMDAAKAERNAARLPLQRWRRRWVVDRLAKPAALHRLLRLYQRSGVQTLVRHSGLLRPLGLERLERLGSALGRPAAETRSEPVTPVRGRVALYPGCLGRHLDAAAHTAAASVLNRLGYQVDLTADPHCCGALHRHDGFPLAADRHLAASRAHYARETYNAVLGCASACTAELRRSPELAAVTRDITRFLADLSWPEHLTPRPYQGRVLVHVPCSQTNQLGDTQAALDLLRRIPDLEPLELTDNATCCGAAGAYLLRQPVMSQRLLQDKLAAIRDGHPDVLVTTNTGCALHLATGMQTAGLRVEICHPVELLARQLPPP